MRDPSSQAQARQPVDGRPWPPRPAAISWECDGEDGKSRCAIGTHEIDRVGLAARAGDDTEFDIAAVPRPIFLFDAARRVVDVNPAAETLVGYTRVELVGAPLDMVVSKLASAEHAGWIGFVPASTGACVRHRNGRAIPVEAVLCRHGEDSTAAILHTVETTEVGLRQDDVAQIVHDLKSPLATIALETCLLDDKIARGKPGEVGDALARITRNIEFLDRMVQDLLDLCSLDAGRLELERKPTELRTLLEQIVDRVIPSRDRGRVVLHAAEPLTMWIDDLRIERVVANLLHNALKYAPGGSGIEVRLAAADDAVRISVSDTGPGLKPDEIGYVFDKFRRASAAGSHEGSGLGLYVSKRIVEAHGGRIDVTSVHGAGCQFFFELPAT